jgi:biopolymer transport protein ExbD
MAKFSSRQRIYIRKRTKVQDLDPSEMAGELNIVPFLDIVMNILIFVLATVSVVFTASIETAPPASSSAGVRQDIESKALNLTVLIVNDGFSLKASGGNVAPGCRGVGAGIAIPKKAGQYDYASLTGCVADLKKSSADYEDETQVFITANPGTDYQTLIGVIDAVRSAPNGDPLFSDVNFKVPR